MKANAGTSGKGRSIDKGGTGMFGDAFKKYVQQVYDGRTNLPEELRKEIEWKLKGCTPEEQLLMKYFYGTMPLGDAGTYGFEVFLGFVHHGLMLYETMEW